MRGHEGHPLKLELRVSRHCLGALGLVPRSLASGFPIPFDLYQPVPIPATLPTTLRLSCAPTLIGSAYVSTQACHPSPHQPQQA